MKKTLLFIVLVFNCFLLKAQTVVIQETVENADTTKKESKSLNAGFMFDVTFFGGLNEKGLKRNLENSVGFNFLFNLKYKIIKNISLIGQFGYNFESYAFKKSDTNTSFPTVVNTNSNERFLINGLSVSIGTRVKITKNVFSEIGVISKLNLSKIYNFESKDVNGNFTDTYIHELDYIKDFNHDVYFRLGYKMFNLVSYYRLNDMFKTVSYAPVVYELPRLRLGVAFGF